MADEKPSSEWELSKENIQPLKQGRKMESLHSALQSGHCDEVHRRLAMQKTDFENVLRTYDGDDPLEPWVSYIEWTEQHFPKGGKEGSLFPLIEKCIIEFRETEQYKNDERYVEICLKLANMSIDPLEVYGFMYGLKTGYTVASFYVTWALALEVAGNVKKADAVFLKGLQNKALPTSLLELRHKEFLHRLVLRTAVNNPIERPEEMEESRSAMGTLKSFGRTGIVGTTRTGSALTNVVSQEFGGTNSSRKMTGRFVVHADENNMQDDAIPTIKRVEAKSCIVSSAGSCATKENDAKPSKWAGVKISRSTVVAAPMTFDVHKDESPSTPVTRQVSRPGAFALSEKKDAHQVSSSAFHGTLSANNDYVSRPNEIPMYRRDLVYGGVEEFQFEEVRAAVYTKRKAEQEKDRLMQEQSKRIKAMEEEIIEMKRQRNKTLKLVSSMLHSKGLPPNAESVKQIMRQLGCEATKQDILDVTSQFSDTHISLNNHVIKTESPNQETKLVPGITRPMSMSESDFKTPFKKNRSITAATPTINTTEAMKIAIAIFNKPNASTLASKCDETHHDAVKSIDSINKPAFEVYIDPESVAESNQSIRSASHLVAHEDAIERRLSLPRRPFDVFVDPRQSVEHNQTMTFPNSKKSLTQKFDIFEDRNELMKANCPFTLSPPFQVLVDENLSDNAENVPPEDNSQFRRDRTLAKDDLSGESVANITREDDDDDSDDESDNDDDDDDGDEESFYDSYEDDKVENQTKAPDITDRLPSIVASFTMPANTLFFTDNAKLVSTPVRLSSSAANSETFEHVKTAEKELSKNVNANGAKMLDSFTNSVSSVIDVKRLVEEIEMQTSTLQIQPARPRPGIAGETKIFELSTITETSRDYKSSSSGSSGTSSAATSHFRSTFSRNKTGGDLSSVVERSYHTPEPNTADGSSSIPLTTIATGGVNPFDENLITKFLDNLQSPIACRSGVLFGSGQMPVLTVDAVIEIRGEHFVIEKIVGSGSYATVFQISHELEKTNEISSEILVLKVQKPACPWEFYIADELGRRLKELKFTVDITSSVMRIPHMRIFSNGSVMATDYHKCTLLDLVNQYNRRHQTIPESLVIYFVIEILHIVEQLHACQIVHADLKPDNFMLMDVPSIEMGDSAMPFGRRTCLLKLIDYGRCIDMSLFPCGTQFTTRVETECFDCIEMKESRPWTYQTDFYGVAACAHVMLFGQYMEPIKKPNSQWQIVTKIRRYWQADEWNNFFDQLLNVPSCDQLPDIAALRVSFEKCLISSKKASMELYKAIKELTVLYRMM